MRLQYWDELYCKSCGSGTALAVSPSLNKSLCADCFHGKESKK